MFQEDLDDQNPGARPVTSHFGAKDLGWQALGPTIACVALSTCIVALRWYTRCRLVRCVGLDDYVILLSMVLAWAMCGVIGAAVHQGVGIVLESPMETATVTQLIVANNAIWAVLINVTKASILMQYLRIFSGPRIKALCYLLLLALLPAALWGVLGGTLLCTPVAKLWNPALPGHCLSAEKYWISVASSNIGLDFLVLLLPMPAITALRLPHKQKISLVLVFLLGFFVCAVSITRLATVLITANEGQHVQSGIWAIIWSVVEANVGIVCACLLALRPLVGRVCPTLLEESQLPAYSMRLPEVQTTISVTRGPWPLSAESSATLVTSPTTPTKSRGGSIFTRTSSARKETMPTVTPVMYPEMPFRVALAGSLGLW